MLGSNELDTNSNAVRVEKLSPDGYRLARKPNGELILQGAYMWQQGRDYGHEWCDIPTVDL